MLWGGQPPPHPTSLSMTLMPLGKADGAVLVAVSNVSNSGSSLVVWFLVLVELELWDSFLLWSRDHALLILLFAAQPGAGEGRGRVCSTISCSVQLSCEKLVMVANLKVLCWLRKCWNSLHWYTAAIGYPNPHGGFFLSRLPLSCDATCMPITSWLSGRKVLW